ncbi:MAG TPA: long-chain fatty acid--CoA ligase [Solirubrobacteraceae bacterium]|jgi:fatty-acyl-CoA synthase|nr:long-chain fatty acid--CoA ligase [Solirubrobacteraceae bacterium]
MKEMLEGLMQDDFPLTLNHLRRRLGSCNHGAEVVSLGADGTSVTRASHAEVSARIDRLAHALRALGVSRGERVGTFAWNNQRHLELYFAVPCTGAVLHTLNIRLFEEQLTYIVNHAEDRVIFVDDSLVPMLAKLAPSFKTVEHYVVMGAGESAQADGEQLPGALSYEQLLADASPEPFDYPEVEERQAASLCYTSGTTGHPKGVLYSHRSISLHSTVTLTKDGTGLSRADRILAVVPMFHVNAWGLPYGAALAGADLIMPDRHLQPEPLAGLIARERPTLMGCVPTIFQGLLAYAEQHPELDLSSLTNAACGGSAVPRQLMKDFEERHAVRIFQAWGMTETSPVATYSRPRERTPDGEAREHDDAYWDERAMQGRPLPWVELRLAGDDGGEVSWDGRSTGEIEVRGPWVASRYFADSSEDEKFATGWLRTGDIASVDERGNVQITDRSKDVIKSGGEWISSVELENELMSHPDVVEAAVIAKPDERWAERPLCCVVLREQSQVDAGQLIEHLRDRVAKWWLPDEFAFVAEIPKTSVGKFDKKVLRARLAQDELEGRVRV